MILRLFNINPITNAHIAGNNKIFLYWIFNFPSKCDSIVNIVVPAAVAGAMGIDDIDTIAKKATRGAYVTSAIPGGIERARDVAKRAATIVKDMS